VIESEVLAEEGGMTVVRHRVPAGFDSAPLHREGDAFHVPGGHLADVLADTELIELTRTDEYRRKAAHLSP
jgi:hypothetical protein